MPEDRLLATYLIETPHPLEHAATVIAGEQSSGTFVAVPGETAELKERFGARVERIVPLEECDTPSLPGSTPPRQGVPPRYRRGLAEISFPLHNFGPSLSALLSTVAGNLYELQELSGIRLLDLDLPPAFARAYPGPAFGVAGTRRLAGVPERALIGTIVKPSIGLSIAQLRPLVRQLAAAGLDFIKDDEIHCNPPYAPLAERVSAVMEELKTVAQTTGRLAMYAFNVTGDMDHMLRGAELVRRAGGTCVMVNVNAVGLPALAHLRRHCELPIHGHRAGYGAMARCPWLGMAFSAWQKLARLAGADHLHVGGMNGKFYETTEEVARSIRDCLAPLQGGPPVVPVISSAQWAGSAPEILAATGAVDVLHLAGGGIIAHPDGVAAGVRSMQQGWEAAVAGVPLSEHARAHPELEAAIRKFGGRSA
jgi:ribulose-bisphosphate carboxylase large chain